MNTPSGHATRQAGGRSHYFARAGASLGCLLAIFALSYQAYSAAAATFDAPIVPADPAAAGRELVARLLAMKPAESVTNEAVLRIRTNKNSQFEVPLRIEVQVTETNWSTTYRTVPTTNAAAATVFTLTRRPSGRNHYELRRDDGDLKGSIHLTADDAMTPFAGSDFWLADLGMEYLQWPTQRLLKKEICRSQSCDKLESIAPEGLATPYVRVISWVDIDTGGPVLVEAYDAKGKMVKEFKPNDFAKVNGQWQVEELEISNLRTGSHSFIHFHLEGK